MAEDLINLILFDLEHNFGGATRNSRSIIFSRESGRKRGIWNCANVTCVSRANENGRASGKMIGVSSEDMRPAKTRFKIKCQMLYLTFQKYHCDYKGILTLDTHNY